MDCPHCHKELVIKDYQHTSIATCNDCGGVWIDPSQLERIISQREPFLPEQIQSSLQKAHSGFTATVTRLSCPVCSQLMGELNYDYSSGVIVNVCPQGHGIWFDKDELEQVQIFMDHWDTEENTEKAELLTKLDQLPDDQMVIDVNEVQPEEQVGDKLELNFTKLMNYLFDHFDNLK
jgi:uncharacterized protein